MSEYTLPNKETVARIVLMAAKSFRSFGGGRGSKSNPLADALKDDPPIFALGVDISEVVTMVLTAAGYQNLLDACNGLMEDLELIEQDEGITACQCLSRAPDDITEPRPCDYCKAKAAIEKAKAK